MWSIILAFIMELIKSKKHTLWGTIVAIIGACFVAFTFGYVQPEIQKVYVSHKLYSDSISRVQEYKDNLLLQKLNSIDANIQDLKDVQKDIQGDIKDLLRGRRR